MKGYVFVRIRSIMAILTLGLACWTGGFSSAGAQITIHEPNSSTVAYRGEQLMIYWSTSYSDPVDIELYKSGSLHTTIASSYSGAVPHFWDIPSGIAEGIDYQVRIAGTTFGAPEAMSSEFTITEYTPTITITETSGSSVEAGADHSLSWTHTLNSGSVILEYVGPFTGGWIYIDTYSTGTTGSYLWTIEETLPNGTPVAGNTDYKIRVAATDGSAAGASEAFTLAFADYVAITAPTSGDGYALGGAMTITFASNVPDVAIDLIGPGGQTIATGYEGHAPSPPNGKAWHDYPWTVPQDLPEGDYQVQITAGAATASSGTFRIGEATARRLVSYDAYDPYGNVLQATGANGAITRYYYGSNTDPFSQSGWNGAQGAYLTAISHLSGAGDSLTTTAAYNRRGLLATLTGQDSVTATFGYDGLGRLDTVYNEAGAPVTAHEYVYADELFSATNPNFITATAYPGGSASPRVSTEYLDGLGRLVQTQQQGADSTIVAAIQYDNQGRTWRTWKPYARAGAVGYEAGFATDAETYYGNPNPFREQLYEASPLNRPDSTIVEGGISEGVVRQGYSVQAWNGDNYFVTTTTDEEGHRTETWADGWGRKVRTVAAPDSAKEAITQFIYDELDQLIEVRHPNDFDPTLPGTYCTTYAYDTRGNLIQKDSPDAGMVRYKYDAAGNLRFSQDAVQSQNGQVLFTTYDFAGRPLASGIADTAFSALQGEATYDFESKDAYRHHVRAWDGKPSASEFPWDQFATQLNGFKPSNPKGQLAAEAFKFTDRATVAGSNHWQLTLYDYDTEGRLAEKRIYTGDRADWATQLEYAYNRLGELIRQKIKVGGDSLYQHYSYNQRGLLDSVWVSGDGIVDTEPVEVAYTYTATGAVDRIDYQGPKDVDYAYTIRDWVERINDVGSPGSSFAASYSYLKNGNIDTTTFHNPLIQDVSIPNRYSYAYSYDGLSRLTGADYSAGGTTSAYDVTGLQYDPSGNILSLQRRDETGSLIDDLGYGAGSNRLDSLSDAAGQQQDWDAGPVADFGYDEGGNLISQTGKFSSITYDHRNLPVRFSMVDGDTLLAAYNAAGQRILKQVVGGSYQFYINDGNRTLAVIEDETLRHINLFGTGLFGRIEAVDGALGAANPRRYYLTDHLGSTRAVVDDGGTVLETFDYYPFGLLMPKRNTANANTREKYTGHELDDEAGLNVYYMISRYYDPATLQFWSPDPILGERNPLELLETEPRLLSTTPYGYVFGNPVNLIDRDGRCPTCDDPEELKRFEQVQVSEGLQFMLDLSFANQNQIKEVASYLIQNDNNEAILVVFDPEGNTVNTSNNPDVGITKSGRVLYDGSEVLAQIHTHPGGSPTPSPPDEKVSEALRSPVFTLTKDNIGVTVGSAFHSRILGKNFKNSVVNKGRSDRLIDYTRTLKKLIEKSRN